MDAEPAREAARLRAEVRRLESLLAASCQGSIVLDAEGRVAGAQPAGERLLGPSPFGSSLTSLVAETQELLLCPARDPVSAAPPPVTRLAGSAAAGLPAAVLVRDADGRPIGLLREGAEPSGARELREERRRLLAALDGGGRQPLRWAPPAELLRQAAARAAPLGEAKRVSVALDLPPDLPAVAADPRLLLQALSELLVNAIRHSSPGGSVRLSARLCRGRRVLLSIADEGPGFPDGALRRRLRALERGEPTDGGLGLALARRAAARHGGRLRGHSRPGRGARLWFRVRSRGRPWRW